MENFSDFLAMGGYAAYVWSSYGLTAAVLAGLWIAASRRRRNIRRMIAAAKKRQ